MKIRRHLFFILVITITLSWPCFSQTINLTPTQLRNHLERYLGQRRNKEWAKFQGKTVQWSGNPMPFGTRGITDQGFVINLSSKAEVGYIWIRVNFPEKDAERLFEVSQSDAVVFEGRLARYSSMAVGPGYHFLIEDARLLGVIKSKAAEEGE